MKPATWIITLCATAAFAQMQDNAQPSMMCRDGNNGGRTEQHCEIKETTIPAVNRITVNGGSNGGVTVRGSNRKDILIRAKVETYAPTLADAQGMASQVTLMSGGGNIHYDSPSSFRDRRGVSVSYEIFVPHDTSMKIDANNGGIRISDVRGDIEFDTQNGGVTLARLAGNVRGRTTNGGLNIELMGDRWEGTQLDAKTTNGGVKMQVPANYSARLEASTVNGGISIDFPITITGKIGRELNTNIGNGGNLIRTTTTNGGISINRKS